MGDAVGVGDVVGVALGVEGVVLGVLEVVPGVALVVPDPGVADDVLGGVVSDAEAVADAAVVRIFAALASTTFAGMGGQVAAALADAL